MGWKKYQLTEFSRAPEEPAGDPEEEVAADGVPSCTAGAMQVSVPGVDSSIKEDVAAVGVPSCTAGSVDGIVAPEVLMAADGGPEDQAPSIKEKVPEVAAVEVSRRVNAQGGHSHKTQGKPGRFVIWVRSRWRTIRRSRRRGGQGTKEKVPETPVKGRKERVVETPGKEKGKDKSLAD